MAKHKKESFIISWPLIFLCIMIYNIFFNDNSDEKKSTNSVDQETPAIVQTTDKENSIDKTIGAIKKEIKTSVIIKEMKEEVLNKTDDIMKQVKKEFFSKNEKEKSQKPPISDKPKEEKEKSIDSPVPDKPKEEKDPLIQKEEKPEKLQDLESPKKEAPVSLDNMKSL